MKTLAELNAVKARMQAELNGNQTRIVVGLATCGIAAGAKPVFDAFVDEAAKNKIDNVAVKQSGCLGMCKLEPMAEVYVPGKEKVTYIRLTEEAARKIINEHIVGGKPVMEYVIGNE